MCTEVLVRNRRNARKPSQRRSGGWLVLQRRLGQSVRLTPADDPQSEARITLLVTEPLTLQLDLAGVGIVELCLHPHQSGVKLGIRADESVRIAREELTL